MNGFVKYKHDKKFSNLNKPIECDGGKWLIERLIHLFEVRNRVELGELLGVTPGTLSTWTTRNTTPYELLIRIHLLTGWSMQYLCFGTGDRYGNSSGNEVNSANNAAESKLIYDVAQLQIYTLKNGGLSPLEKFEATDNIIQRFKVKGSDNDFVLDNGNELLFIDTNETTVSHGKYLFEINNIHQLGELRLMPDGKTYLLEAGTHFPVEKDAMKVIGKVVSVLKKM